MILSCSEWNGSLTNKPDLKELIMVDINYVNIWTGTPTGLCDNTTNLIMQVHITQTGPAVCHHIAVKCFL